MKYKIKELKYDDYKNFRLPIHFEINEAYVLEASHSKEKIVFNLVRKRLSKELINEDEGYDKLFQDHWDNPKAWGVIIDDKLIAAIETSEENWNNRLRITELWVDDEFQRLGLGTVLMNLVKEEAKKSNRRAIVLETQSSNVKAIDFYLNCGFKVIGFDAIHYTNNDVENNMFRLELAYLLGE